MVLFYEYDMDNYSKLGFELKIIEDLFFRAGLDKSDLTLGIGLRLKNINLDYAYVNNNPQILGNSHAIGMIINLNN